MLTNTVAVVIPFFNDGRYLRETIHSVKNQTLRPSEIIVVDDGSQDPESLNVLGDLRSDPAIRVLRKENGGLASARNHGIANAESEFMVPLDADDMLCPEFIESCLAAFSADPALSIVATGVRRFGGQDAPMKFPQISRRNMLVMNCLVATAMYRKEVWESVGGYNENMVFGYEDWDFWLSCIELGMRFHRIPGELFRYRVKEQSMVVALLEDPERKKKMKHQLKLNHERLFSSEKVSLCRELYLKARYIYANQVPGNVFARIFSAKSGSNRSQA